MHTRFPPLRCAFPVNARRAGHIMSGNSVSYNLLLFTNASRVTQATRISNSVR